MPKATIDIRGERAVRSLRVPRACAAAITVALLTLFAQARARAETAVAQLSAGDGHTCTVKTDGTLWCWGDNAYGELGDGTRTRRLAPVQVTALGNSVVEVSAGHDGTCARKLDGTLWCWGDNAYGQLGDGTTTQSSTPVQVTALGTNVTDVSTDWYFTCALKLDGTLWCWGDNHYGQLGNGTTTGGPAPAQVVGLGSTVAEVSIGFGHTCARKLDNTLWCWGRNEFAELGDGTFNNQLMPKQVAALGSQVAEVFATAANTCARKLDGTLWCWGDNWSGQIGDGSTTTRSTPVQVTTLGAAVAEITGGDDVSAGHTCARKTDGTLWCWGENQSGQLGDGTTSARMLPVQVATLGGNVVEISAGFTRTCARTANGLLWCWGGNAQGQLGDGSTTTRTTPVLVPGLTFFQAVPASPAWALGLLALALLAAGYARQSVRARPGARG